MNELKAVACHRCDFSSGRRGMDLCGTCDGTGSVVFVDGAAFPNTKDGWAAAEVANQPRTATFPVLCSDCPPVDYPTDKTRCADCPRHTHARGTA